MKRKPVAVIGVILLLAAAGVGGYIMTNQRRSVKQTPPPAPQTHIERPAEPAPRSEKVKVFGVTVVDGQERLESEEVEVASEGNRIEAALRHLVEQGSTSRVTNPIPEGTRLLSLKTQDGLATVNLSSEFCDNFSGGSDAETMMVRAILKTLGQFREIKRVQLLVDGQTPELGHLDLSEPLGVDDLDSDNGGEN